MKSFAAGIVLTALIAISIFGFVGLSEMHQAMGESCPGSFSSGTPCPINDGVFAFSLFHFKSLQSLSQSGFLNVSPMFFLAMILSFVAFLIFSPDSPALFSVQSYFRKNYEDKVGDVGPKMIFWLSHLENSPNLLKGA